MTLITQNASRISKDMVRALAEHGAQVKGQVREVADKAATSLDKLVLSSATRANKVTYHVGAEETFKAIMGSLDKAEKSFHIETFIWHDDESGRQLAEALVNKVKTAKDAGKTFDAKVLIDSIGLKSGYGTDDKKIVEFLNQNGVEARIFNPKKVNVEAKGMLPLTHRKLYIADGQRYQIGGRNVGDEYFKSQYHTKWGDEKSLANSYHDFAMTVEGEETGRVQGEFFKNWKNAGGTVPETLPVAKAPADAHTRIQTFVTDPLTGEQGLKEAHLKAIANAKREINVISPYFADDDFVNALISAKQKNTETRAKLLAQATNKYERHAVDQAVPELKVRALMPISGEKGKDLNYQIDMETARQLLDAGIEVRLSKGGVEGGKAIERFSHFKGMTIDGELLSVGSANADYRTYNTNHEIVNLVADREKVAEFNQKVTKPDWEAAMPITQDWIKKNSTWTERAFRKVAEALDFLY
ncbi:MAG TPA: phosphatidylserine/phosphatidylglycerophosphate/cardiolipin synthase family protein [Stenomitos sp.]